MLHEVDSLSWHQLSVPNQKVAVLFLAAVQNSISLTAAMVELNVATYLQVNDRILIISS